MAATPKIPVYLLAPCVEPGEPEKTLLLLRAGRRDEAATEFARYVIDVRDAFEICNGQIDALREYADNMGEFEWTNK